MRHATAWAVAEVVGTLEAHHCTVTSAVRACDWTRAIDATFAGAGDQFTVRDTQSLLAGNAAVLPDCPTCAAFIDLALSIRAEEAQTRINAEIDAEQRMTA